MKSLPILFSAPMVRALLDGSKTQTRRVVKPQPYIDDQNNFWWNGSNFGQNSKGPNALSITSPLPSSKTKRPHCPHGVIGDQLWVRETFLDMHGTGIEYDGNKGYCFRADINNWGNESFKDYGLKWKPSIFMPRVASRITLEITGVRVERLQDISEADATAEGTPHSLNHPAGRTAIENYEHLWECLNGDDSWSLNPWVWVIEFKKVKP